jgi:hypothetical protein
MTVVEPKQDEIPTREFTTENGESWEAIAIDAVVAHGKVGAVLAMRPLNDSGVEPLRTTITFNSREAAAFALRTLGEKELRRRLSIARGAASGA